MWRWRHLGYRGAVGTVFSVDISEVIGLAEVTSGIAGSVDSTRAANSAGLSLTVAAFGDSAEATELHAAHSAVVVSGEEAARDIAALLRETGDALKLAAAAFERTDQDEAFSFLGIAS